MDVVPELAPSHWGPRNLKIYPILEYYLRPHLREEFSDFQDQVLCSQCQSLRTKMLVKANQK